MQYTQQELDLDRDSWRHKLAFPDSAGLYDREAEIQAVLGAGRQFEPPPEQQPVPNFALLRGPIMAEIAVEMERAANSPFVHSDRHVLESRPIDLTKLSISGVQFTGAHHAETGAPCQDQFRAAFGKHCVAAAISDGSSSSHFSEVGASILASRAVDIAGGLLERAQGPAFRPNSAEFLWALLSGLNNEAVELCVRSGIDYRLAADSIFSATLHLVLVTERSVTHLALCDGYLRDGNDNSWRPASHFAGRPFLIRTSEVADRHPPFPLTPYATVPLYEELKRHSESVLHPPTNEDLEKMRLFEAIKESLSFRILSHTSAEEAFRAPVQFATDGIRFTFADNGKIPFPLDKFFPRLGGAEAGEAMTLWNLAAALRDTAGESNTYCAPGYIRDLVLPPDSEVGREFLRRLSRTKVWSRLPGRTGRTTGEAAADLMPVLARSVSDHGLRIELSLTASPIARELLDYCFALCGAPRVPNDGRPLRQLFDDLSVLCLRQA